jgi:uncharacterized protein YaaR (DUF327 family)
MKIKKTEGTQRTSSTKKKKETSESPRISFVEVLKHQSIDDQRVVLQGMLDEIEDMGNQLVQTRTVENLLAYKDMVKAFVDEAVREGLAVDERGGFSRRGRTKVLRLVEQVDKKLLELTDIILRQEKRQLEILRKVGQIQGLLLNFFV